MFIENPNKKESYSFRVKPDLLEKIKNYANATGQTVPEILNDMIEEKVEGLHLTNDYLENKLNFNGVISLPPLTEIYDNGKYKEFNLFTERSNKVLYEIQRVPNNLDIWTDKEGYKSDQRGVDHEGLSFILAPELITKPEYLETPELLLCCLVPVYFRVNIKQIRKSTIAVTNISFDKAFTMINKTNNIELLDDFTRFTSMVKDIIMAYHNRFKNATENPDGTYYAGGFTYNDKTQLLLDLFSRLIIELNEYSINVNTNVLSHYDRAMERATTPEEELKNIDVGQYNQFDTITLLGRVEDLKKENDELKTENKEIKSNLDNLEKQFNDFKRAFIEIDKKEYTKEEILEHISKG